MANKRLSSWFQSILPANYRQVASQTGQYQQFLVDQLPDSVVDSVQVIKADSSEIVVAVSSASVANFLRLHVRELQQQIHETFNSSQTLKFKTMPDSVLHLEQRSPVKKPQSVSSEAIEAISNNAQWIEDDKLKQALESLARELKKKAGR